MTDAGKKFLNARGITDAAISLLGLDSDDDKIIIPVKNKEGKFLFNKYRTFPEKKYFYDSGASVALFGLGVLKENWCVLCEGELDAARLCSENIPAVSSTGGAGAWRDEWVGELPTLVFVCYDSDPVGTEAAQKVHWKLPGSRLVTLPSSSKDVTDFLQGSTREDFMKLIRESHVVPKPPAKLNFRGSRPMPVGDTDTEKAKAIPIDTLLKFQNRKAVCIWHKDTHPSLYLYPQENKVWCFACNQGGDAIDVTMKLHNLSFRDAIKKLTT